MTFSDVHGGVVSKAAHSILSRFDVLSRLISPGLYHSPYAPSFFVLSGLLAAFFFAIASVLRESRFFRALLINLWLTVRTVVYLWRSWCSGPSLGLRLCLPCASASYLTMTLPLRLGGPLLPDRPYLLLWHSLCVGVLDHLGPVRPLWFCASTFSVVPLFCPPCHHPPFLCSAPSRPSPCPYSLCLLYLAAKVNWCLT